ncbi:PTS system mannose/fructose/sorbose family transporter subunit IID [Bacillus niameyensis]|uniref:PTS system mannose/fructose/sorbose family transporter subunit IID n=1 Tax=Bacillus niameyensis TaxID=1522308 RepID=UPI000780E608|nr:PTS system mannose/fructose/sorbose family transporter subunit IID [Bacillus niameyensis]
MNITIAIILALVAGFAYFSRRFFGDWYIERPIIIGPLVGLIMGDLETGLMVGAMLELIFMGAADIGGAAPPNYTIGAVLGTAFAISSNLDVQAALVIAIPAALVGSLFEIFAKTICTFFVNAADRAAEKGNTKGISIVVHSGNLVHALSYAIPTFLALAIGADIVNTIIEAIPSWLENGIKVAGNMLPALGFALLLSSLVAPALFPFFFAGFLGAAYLNIDVLGMALFGFIIAFIIQTHFKKGENEEGAEITAEAAKGFGDTIAKKDLKTIFFRSFALQSSFSFDRMQAIGFTWGLLPFLKKIYKNNPAGLIASLKRNLTFFNTHPWTVGPIIATTANLEARKARGEDIDEKSIQGLKSSLMGPLAGIGDSMFHGTLRPVMGGVCAALALQGNPIAPLLFFITVNAVHVTVKWFLLKKGYDYGEQAIGMLATNKLKKVMDGATMAGLVAVGALVASWLKVQTALVYTAEEKTFEIQAMLDNILPKMLPLAVTLLIFWLIRKQVKTVPIMLGIIIGGIILGSLKILAG